jgi:antitoxin (DNA-binding transcriptional repressor) of toxin-antitoxin stability system
MPKLITATNMIRSFSNIVGRVYYKGETFDIKKGNYIVARLSPVKARSTISIADLNDFFKSSPHLESEDIKDFEDALKLSRSIEGNGGSDKWE